MQALEGQVAVVAGGTRGAGRGIACMLGEAGATVYVTGRSVRGQGATPGRPETIEETAEMVDGFGGRGIPVRVDHTEEIQVQALFERIEGEVGRLDILVNDIWGGDALTEWGKPFWELNCTQGFELLQRAIHTHILTSRHAVPLMFQAGRGLVVEITDGDEAFNRNYRENLFYDLAKTTVSRLAYDMSAELRDTGVTALALSPGFLRSEHVLEHFGVAEQNWRDAIVKDPYFADSESPFYIGRAIAALAADPCVRDKAGVTHTVASLMREYKFRDLDGQQPDIGQRFEETIRERWEQILVIVRGLLHSQGQDPDCVSHDQARLEIRGRLPNGRVHRWQARLQEVFHSDPQEVAEKFDASYRARLG